MPAMIKGMIRMNTDAKKCVVVVDQNLPLGIITNTAAVLGATLGRQCPELIGEDVVDASQCRHMGIITIPIPVLKCGGEKLRELREKLYEEEYENLVVADFSDVAQGCKTYDEYTEKVSGVSEEGHRYFGIAICGDRKAVNSLTGSMPLLR